MANITYVFTKNFGTTVRNVTLDSDRRRLDAFFQVNDDLDRDTIILHNEALAKVMAATRKTLNKSKKSKNRPDMMVIRLEGKMVKYGHIMYTPSGQFAVRKQAKDIVPVSTHDDLREALIVAVGEPSEKLKSATRDK